MRALSLLKLKQSYEQLCLLLFMEEIEEHRVVLPPKLPLK